MIYKSREFLSFLVVGVYGQKAVLVLIIVLGGIVTHQSGTQLIGV